MIVNDFHLNHVSTGDLLRKIISSGSPLGSSIKSIVNHGKLIPDELMLKTLLGHCSSLAGKILLDGFPRTVSQADLLSKFFNVLSVIALDVPYQTIMERLANLAVNISSPKIQTSFTFFCSTFDIS